ncbi:Imm1 family immunity protein [Actinokineospora sp. NPDC004072]
MIITASLTSGIAHVARGRKECERLIDVVLNLEHVDWETVLAIGDVEYHQTADGPFPNQQLRISVSPSRGIAAISFTDHQDPDMTVANSHNPSRTLEEHLLIFNGASGTTFPADACISIPTARRALREWLETRKRPSCIRWRPA